ncbi:MAG: hypothetical protein CMN30_31560 [Sandaracinus sp.]|nr:hypothetical protein [Sandaracinus sp.]
MVDDIFFYSLAHAAMATRVSVHLSTRMPTHHHTDVTPSEDNLPDFTARFHSDVAGAVKTLLAHERYEPPQTLWDGRDPHYMRLVDAPAQAAQLTYDYLNPAAAGLVSQPTHMPGRTLDFAHWKTEGLVIKRPPVYFDRSRPEELLLELEPPPLLMREFNGDLKTLVYHMERMSRDGLRAIRAARTGSPLGAQRLRRIHPHDEPRTPAEPGGQRIPTFRIGARGAVGAQTYVHACRETTHFRQEHERCRKARLAGSEPMFPHGTYAMRVMHGATVAEPLDDALLTQPGPLLHEVLSELETVDRVTSDPQPLIREVNEAWADEAADIVSDNELSFGTPAKEARALPLDPDERPEPETVHVSDVRRERERNPKRVITRRDKRRGRPKGSGSADGRNKARGADPPSDT